MQQARVDLPASDYGLAFSGFRCQQAQHRLPQGGTGSGSWSANAVPQRTAKANADSRFANCPRSPSDVASPSSSRIETRAMNVFPTFETDGRIATP